ncbi:interferon gamma [Odontesthes bonariensis]|uniref:interferon gamma 1-like n=1 Tax=Odontesthes bonariensis TaxID=219752 RepID=UPI003F583B99
MTQQEHRCTTSADMMAAMVRAVVCLLLWTSVSPVSGSYVDQDMNRTIQNFLQHYNISMSDIFNGKPVFSREPLNGKIETKMVFMGGVLEMYENLIQHILKQYPTPSPLIARSKEKAASSITAESITSSGKRSEATRDIRQGLEDILDKIQKVKKHYYQEQVKLVHGLHELRRIQMNNLKVQGKALWELSGLFDEAGSLAKTISMKRRRRRQAKTKAYRRG